MRSEETLGESKTPSLKLEIINNVKFSRREIDVIACVIAGRGSKTIASLLTIAPKTVDAHIHNIMGKITCSSREDIINFIEKSDKYLFLRQIYQDLLLKSDFRKTLIAISTLLRNKMLPQVIIYQYELSESEIILTYNLEEHFKLAGIANINRIEKDSFFSLKWDDINCHIIHIVSEELTKKLQKNIIEGSAIQYKFIDVILQNPTNHTLLLLDKNISIIPQKLLRIDYVSFKAQNSHYLVVLEVLRRIIGKVNIEPIISNFKKNLSLVSERPEKLFSNKVNSAEEFVVRKNIFPLIKKIFIENKISILIAYIIFIIIALISYSSSQKNQEAKVSRLIKPQKLIISTKKNLTSWNIPRQNHVFVGREKLLDDLHNKLHQNHTPEAVSNLAISACSGLGGIGKTQLALQYVNHTKHPYTLKVWFPAENIDYLYSKYVEFAKLLGYTEAVYTKENIIAYVKQWLIDNPGWLLVFDNVNNYREIEPFLPEAGGYVILTTRQRHWSTKFAILPIDIMTEEEAIKTIKTLIQRDIAKEQNAIKELVEVLGYLPLALVQAGSYIKQKHITVPEYLYLYKRYESELLADNTFLDETTTYNYPVAITWNISLEAIVRDTKANNEPPIAIELLTVAAYLAPDKISRELLLTWLQTAYPHLSSPRLTLNKHIALLWQYSMINYDDNDNIAIHRLVQTVLRHQLHQSLDNKNSNNSICSTLNLRWFELLLQFFIDNEHEFKLTNSFQQLIETGQKFKTKFKDKYNENLAAMDLMISSVYFYQERYEDFLKILDEVNRYLQKTNGLEILKCKILYLYSAYYLKTGNYQKVEEKINKAFYEYNNIKISKSVKDNDIKILKAKLLCNKVNLVLAKNNVNKTTDKINANTLEIETSIKSIQEAIVLFNEAHDTRDFLRSIRLYGKLLILTNQVDKVIIEFTKYNNLIEQMADDRTKMLFYITYSDAYFSKGNFNKALEYCDKAKQQAEKLHLNNELNNINNKEKTIKGVLKEEVGMV